MSPGRRTRLRMVLGGLSVTLLAYGIGYMMGWRGSEVLEGEPWQRATLVVMAGLCGYLGARVAVWARLGLHARHFRAHRQRHAERLVQARNAASLTSYDANDPMLPKAADALLAVLGQVLAPCQVALFVADRSGTLRVRATHPREKEAGDPAWPPALVAQVVQALHARVRADPAAAPVVADVKEHELRVVPVFEATKGGKAQSLWGALVVRRHGVGISPAADVALIEGVASQLGSAWSLEQALRASRRNLERLERIATTDGLTDLVNQRHFSKVFSLQLARAKRYKRRLSLIFLDIDHFKEVNDTFGHAMGNTVLKKVAEVLRNTARCTDIVARVGGEEFAVLMEETGPKGAERYAERIREAMAREIFGDNAGSFSKTCSLGVATFPEHGEEADRLMARADQALYEAKRTGRNKTIIYRGQVPLVEG